MPSVQSFHDLEVWQRSIDLTVHVYQLTKQFPREEIYGLTSQMRRSAVSIPSNIAEGSGRARTPDLMRFLSIARGSNCELQTQLVIARKLELGTGEQIDAAEDLSHRVGKMLFNLLQTLESKSTMH